MLAAESSTSRVERGGEKQMETPLENTGGVVEVTEIALPVEEQKPASTSDTPFDTGLAARYSVANFGSSVVYALLNLAMPLYLQKYGVVPWLIGPLANERAFVGAIAQPVVGRISDRTRTPFGRRKPFFLIGVPLMSLSLFVLAGHPNIVVLLTVMTIGSFFLAVAQDPYLALIADLFPE